MIKMPFVVEVDVYKGSETPAVLFIQAKGRTSSTGWSDPCLIPYAYISPPQDGIMDFDLAATPPQGNAGAVLCDLMASFTMELPPWCRGVRVHAAQNDRVKMIGDTEVSVLHSGRAVSSAARGDADQASKSDIAKRSNDFWPWVHAAPLANTTAGLQQSGAKPKADLAVSDLIGRRVRVIRDGDPVDMQYVEDRVTFVLAKDSDLLVDVLFG